MIQMSNLWIFLEVIDQKLYRVLVFVRFLIKKFKHICKKN